MTLSWISSVPPPSSVGGSERYRCAASPAGPPNAAASAPRQPSTARRRRGAFHASTTLRTLPSRPPAGRAGLRPGDLAQQQPLPQGGEGQRVGGERAALGQHLGRNLAGGGDRSGQVVGRHLLTPPEAAADRHPLVAE